MPNTMLPFFYIFAMVFAGEGAQAKGGFAEFWNTYFNYPGFELWRFINLAIFLAILVYLLGRPLSEKFRAKREAIRANLIKAEQERQAALTRLTAAEAKLVAIEPEKSSVMERAKREAAAEQERIRREAEDEVAKLKQQTSGEVARLSKQIRLDLRRFSADESIRLAEEKLRTRVNDQTDTRLVRKGIDAIGGMN